MSNRKHLDPDGVWRTRPAPDKPPMWLIAHDSAGTDAVGRRAPRASYAVDNYLEDLEDPPQFLWTVRASGEWADAQKWRLRRKTIAWGRVKV